MRSTYLRQALFLAILAVLFFILISTMLIVNAHGEESSELNATSLSAQGTDVSVAEGLRAGGALRRLRRILGPVSSDVSLAQPTNPVWNVSGGGLAAGAGTGGRSLNSPTDLELAEGWGWCGYSGERYWSRKSRRGHHTKRRRRLDKDDDTGLLLRYNRVEGLFVGAQLNRARWYRLDYNVALWGHGGYGFSSKAWRYQLGLERLLRIERNVFFALGGEVHDLTETQDDWIIPTSENSLAAFLIKEDFRDYYRRQGYSAYLEQNLGSKLILHAEYRDDELFNVPAEPAERTATNWSLFGGRKVFRPNPLIDEGRYRGALGRLVLDTRDDETVPDEGWYVQAQAEFYGGKVSSDYEFDRFILDVRRYQPLGYGENLDIRLRAGTSRAALPTQFLFDLGGISTLRGRRFKAFTGNRMVLANLEYRIRADSRIFSDFPLDLFGGMNLILFVDAGRAWFCDRPDRFDRGFRDLKWSDLKTDVGIAITDRHGKVRLNVARATDSGSAPLVVTFRLNRPF